MRFALVAAGVNLLVFWAFRVAFWLVFRNTSADASTGEVLQAIFIGFKFDLRLVLLTCLPPLVLSAIPLLNPVRYRLTRGIWLGYFIAVQGLFVLMYFIDFGHYDYVRTRLNASSVELLQPFEVAAQMLWETYPVVWGVLGLALLLAGYAYLMWRTAFRELVVGADKPLAGWPKRSAVAVFVVLYIFGIYGKWSWYPLRWSDAYFTTNESVAALALNPVLFFADTYSNRTDRYSVRRVRKHYDEVVSYLGVDKPDPETLTFERYVTPSSGLPGKPNLVIIHMESFAGFKVGALGNKLKPTPQFDAVANDGILFSNFFVSGHPTARSVFSMITGIPDVNPRRSASRNPLVVNQHTLVTALEGYEKFYFLGGSATWGNIRGILSHNIPGLHVYEEGDYEAPRADAWGVPDLALFEKAHTVLERQDKPFFAFIQTAGNHRPYTIPEDKGEFELVEVDEETILENNFESLASYNGIRFLDYSLGAFFDLARRSPYFNNTVFVMYGDHGTHTPKPTPWEHLLLTQYHVPLLIYAPGFIKEGRRIDTVASSADSLPTYLNLMGVPHLNTTVGRDLLAPRPAEQRFAFIHRALLTDDLLLRVGARNESHLYRYRSDTPTVELSAQFPQETAKLRRLYDGIYETSRYMLYHNPPRPHTPQLALTDKE